MEIGRGDAGLGDDGRAWWKEVVVVVVGRGC